MATTIRAIQADITTISVDAIVNAANSSLLGGGGVDAAIHRAAGPDLVAACRLLGGCETGEAKITKAYKLPAFYVIHTVGPVWSGGENSEPDQLRACYANSLALAVENKVATIAFPSISTGVYAYPKELAATIAVNTVRNLISDPSSTLEEVTFCCFSAEDLAVYTRLLGKDGD